MVILARQTQHGMHSPFAPLNPLENKHLNGMTVLDLT